ncbi:MAG: Long-chain-fatty-acid--CoA ligase [Pseudonocardia sp.]|nr:Long-chain-fatty-acid--CoA ligase [Pseudonocardia sp.]
MGSSPSPGERVGLQRNLADLVTAAAERGPEHPALIDPVSGEIVRWAELDRAVDAEARRLRASQVNPGDRVLIRLPSSAAFSVALFGALRAGGVAVPVGTGAASRELELIVADSSPSVVVGLPDDEVLGTAAATDGVTVLDAPRIDEEAAGGEPSVGGGEDIAVLSYTSGTTGVPRGVQLSHRALLANRAQIDALRPAPVTPGDRVLLTLPLFHIFGLGAGLLQVCWAGATGVLVNRFDPAATLEVIREHRITVVAGVPAMYRAWLDLPAELLRARFNSARLCTAGGAPLPAHLLGAFAAATGLEIIEGYGLTETGPVLTSNQVSGVAKPGSVGRPLPGGPGVAPVEIRLVDSSGRPLDEPDGLGDVVFGGEDDLPGSAADDEEDELEGLRDPVHDTGLVAARGPNLFSGYWPDGAGGPDEQGWFRTGDVGFFDGEGDLHLVDRTSDLVIVNGFNVYPREVEQVLMEHPAVAEAAVVGVPDDRSGEAVKAVIVLQADRGSELTEQDVREFCTQRLARFKVPTVVQFVEQLPRSPIGKLYRRSLR